MLGKSQRGKAQTQSHTVGKGQRLGQYGACRHLTLLQGAAPGILGTQADCTLRTCSRYDLKHCSPLPRWLPLAFSRSHLNNCSWVGQACIIFPPPALPHTSSSSTISFFLFGPCGYYVYLFDMPIPPLKVLFALCVSQVTTLPSTLASVSLHLKGLSEVHGGGKKVPETQYFVFIYLSYFLFYFVLFF